MKKWILIGLIVWFAAYGTAAAQMGGCPMMQGQKGGMMGGMKGGMMGGMKGGMMGGMMSKEDGMHGHHKMFKGMWWKADWVKDAITLTPEETAKLEEIYVAYKRKMFDLKNQVEKEEFEKKLLWGKADIDEAAYMAQVKKYLDAKAAKMTHKAKYKVEIRKILGADRYAKLKESCPCHGGKMKGMKHGGMEGHGPMHHGMDMDKDDAPKQEGEGHAQHGASS